jgi:hypothetical protein
MERGGVNAAGETLDRVLVGDALVGRMSQPVTHKIGQLATDTPKVPKHRTPMQVSRIAMADAGAAKLVHGLSL